MVGGSQWSVGSRRKTEDRRRKAEVLFDLGGITGYIKKMAVMLRLAINQGEYL